MLNKCERKPPIREYGALVAVLLLALGLRLGAGFVWQSRLEGPFAFGDSKSYWVLAGHIARGEPFAYGWQQVFRTPGYPAVLAPLFWLAGGEPPVMWARAISAGLGTLAVLGVWLLARQLFMGPVPLIAAAVAAVYPGAVAMGVVVLSEAAFCPVMVFHLLFWILAWRGSGWRRSLGWAIAAGFVAGMATLIRPSWLLFVPFGMVCGCALSGRRMRHFVLGLAMLGGLVAAMLPWWIRNYRVTGRFVPTTLQVGASLYDALNPQATGASDMRFVEAALAAERDAFGALGGNPARFEYHMDQILRQAAWEFVRQNPARALQLAEWKFVRTWNVWPNEPAFSLWPIRLAVLCSYVPVLLLALLGMVLTLRHGWPYVLCWLPAVYFGLLHAVFVGSIRYRQPAMLGLIVLAAGAAVWMAGIRVIPPGAPLQGEKPNGVFSGAEVAPNGDDAR